MSLTDKPADPLDQAAAKRNRTGWMVPVLIAVVIAALLLIAGLDISGFGGKSPTSGASISVIDDAGRTVTEKSVPHRLVVLAPSAMDVVFRLGLRSEVVGIDGGPADAGGVATDYSPDQIQAWGLANLTVVTWEPNIDIETVLALNPGLVVGGIGTPLTGLETLWTQDGIPTVYLSPPTLAGVEYDVSIMGTLTGTTSAAASLNAQMETSLVADQNMLDSISAVPRAFLTYYPDSGGYWSFGPGTFGNDLLVQAGATSITANDTYADEGEISGSYILAAQPDVIIVGIGYGITEQNYSMSPDWSQFSAVQNNHVIQVDANDLSEPDPTMVLWLGTLITLLHPELDGGPPL